MSDSVYDYTSDRLYVIIPAAGQSRRMGGTESKQLIPVGDIPVLVRTLMAFESFGSQMRKSGPFTVHGILVTAEGSIEDITALCAEYRISFVEKIIAGGQTRQDSVWNGVCALRELDLPPRPDDIIFIHDGARCFVDLGTLRHCLTGAEEFGVCAAAVPLKDTIKQVDSKESKKVVCTPDRSTLYSIQTPQAFQYSLLVRSYESGLKGQRTATDDTSLAEAIGLPVHLVEGSYSNIKITTPDDLLTAELLLNSRRNAVQ